MNSARSEPDGKRSFIAHKIPTPVSAPADKLNEPDKPLGLNIWLCQYLFRRPSVCNNTSLPHSSGDPHRAK